MGTLPIMTTFISVLLNLICIPTNAFLARSFVRMWIVTTTHFGGWYPTRSLNPCLRCRPCTSRKAFSSNDEYIHTSFRTFRLFSATSPTSWEILVFSRNVVACRGLVQLYQARRIYIGSCRGIFTSLRIPFIGTGRESVHDKQSRKRRETVLVRGFATMIMVSSGHT